MDTKEEIFSQEWGNRIRVFLDVIFTDVMVKSSFVGELQGVHPEWIDINILIHSIEIIFNVLISPPNISKHLRLLPLDAPSLIRRPMEHTIFSARTSAISILGKERAFRIAQIRLLEVNLSLPSVEGNLLTGEGALAS